MRKVFLLVCLGMFFSGWGSAQMIVNMSLDDFYREFRKYQYNDKVGETSEVGGSPYDRVEFIPGEIVTTSRQRYTGIPLRLNIYSNQIEFRNEEGHNFNIGLPDLIEYAMIGEEKYVYCPYAFANRIEKGYFRVLSEGKALLLQKKNVLLKPAEPAGAYRDAVPAHFARTEDDFYLRILPGEAKRLKNRKNLAEILGDYPSEIEDFIKRNKIRFSKAEDLVLLMEYYDALEK
ncbi:MAG: hypothetical protein WBK43_04645 [Prolixibacteraceae bacterium]|jgi:hypothetical protein|nr:hypothetical protein [Prolixibacteraceae bacterium]MDI9564700.1 hypothetical protein [Bacteroidota bacterium]NLS98726.1 hypothetical protein [Bacteroidales bacterium]OQB81972.1 MAG: hypothetical protein BWX87_00274 [Bacteroidetes bacterium ADurb.Bin123]HNU78940.1 hypothetical protein [Prolixibacteraceae bacterium]